MGRAAAPGSTNVPNNQALRGVELHWQVARIDAYTNAITLTNSVVTHSSSHPCEAAWRSATRGGVVGLGTGR
ncbi:MAG TPA: hypothetical protein VFD82_03115 [Planctomycetota bacterium]|nr:hypothetical protein [Planctomycetota bacterium]